MSAYTSQTAPLSVLLQRAADQTGVPLAILQAVQRAENGAGNPNEVSSAGAVGYMQVLPGTGADMGLNVYDPWQNVLAGATYLKQLYQRFGTWDMAFRAYNYGPNSSNLGSSGAQRYSNSVLSNLGLNPGGSPVSQAAGDTGTAGDTGAAGSAGSGRTILYVLAIFLIVVLIGVGVTTLIKE